jgi:hypothetical protein
VWNGDVSDLTNKCCYCYGLLAEWKRNDLCAFANLGASTKCSVLSTDRGAYVFSGGMLRFHPMIRRLGPSPRLLMTASEETPAVASCDP